MGGGADVFVLHIRFFELRLVCCVLEGGGGGMREGGAALAVEEVKEGLVELTGVHSQRIRGDKGEVETHRRDGRRGSGRGGGGGGGGVIQ